MDTKHATLQLPDQTTIQLPVHQPTLGQPVIDIEALSRSGVFTLDPGYLSTACCESKITYTNGAKGELLYRGYPIEQLAEQSDFLDVAYLLLNGQLPSVHEHQQFTQKIKYYTLLHEQVIHFYRGFRRDAHPMAIMLGVVSALSAFYHDSLDIQNPEHREIAALRLIAKMPTIAAMCHKYAIGQPFIYPDNNLDYTSNFLKMMLGVPTEPYHNDPNIAKALDCILILHADHELNASTATVRLAGSTGANPFACISAGIAALWGPAHGGANEASLNMLQAIGDIKHIPKFIERAKDKSDPFRLMGFGHRVYKQYDPRAKIMRHICHQMLDQLDAAEQPLFKVAIELERIALEDDYFIKRKLYPNVDFYSGLTLKAIGIPVNMFTVIFALARTVGWVSHWHEMISDQQRLSRPRQLYTGSEKRTFVPLAKRDH